MIEVVDHRAVVLAVFHAILIIVGVTGVAPRIAIDVFLTGVAVEWAVVKAIFDAILVIVGVAFVAQAVKVMIFLTRVGN